MDSKKDNAAGGQRGSSVRRREMSGVWSEGGVYVVSLSSRSQSQVQARSMRGRRMGNQGFGFTLASGYFEVVSRRTKEGF